ncbi:uncharacterized protein PITG_17100 [Phytophthora infestans T30-4]|uniref:Uncharacterized protein n=1 Tax=Phytophthora infestans (strain T30-4) TaxID=403677 RepID=D0NV11_PHYIT|nr:uncharacterized protein PITG_17100 [Phytophthora infestans T30-4]EEY66483.1 conserved hypothetical protein [Phytophthora infestans T30-4]|eukprot:XP_002897002.1 conserved hypothetical protein [Phytophthora infestans T30-4]
MADYKLFWIYILAQASYSPQYVKVHGAEAFLYPDAARSVSYSAGNISSNGDGYSNNAAFGSAFTPSSPLGRAAIANDGLVKSTWPMSGGTAASTTIANQTAHSAFVAGSGLVGSIVRTWNYILKIKLTDLHPIFKDLDLMASPQICLRFRGMVLASTTLASGNTCPGAIQ